MKNKKLFESRSIDLWEEKFLEFNHEQSLKPDSIPLCHDLWHNCPVYITDDSILSGVFLCGSVRQGKTGLQTYLLDCYLKKNIECLLSGKPLQYSIIALCSLGSDMLDMLLRKVADNLLDYNNNLVSDYIEKSLYLTSFKEQKWFSINPINHFKSVLALRESQRITELIKLVNISSEGHYGNRIEIILILSFALISYFNEPFYKVGEYVSENITEIERKIHQIDDPKLKKDLLQYIPQLHSFQKNAFDSSPIFAAKRRINFITEGYDIPSFLAGNNSMKELILKNGLIFINTDGLGVISSSLNLLILHTIESAMNTTEKLPTTILLIDEAKSFDSDMFSIAYARESSTPLSQLKDLFTKSKLKTFLSSQRPAQLSYQLQNSILQNESVRVIFKSSDLKFAQEALSVDYPDGDLISEFKYERLKTLQKFHCMVNLDNKYLRHCVTYNPSPIATLEQVKQLGLGNYNQSEPIKFDDYKINFGTRG